MSEQKKRPTVDVLGSFLEQAKLDRVVQEEAEKSDEQIAAGLAAAGVTRKQVDAVFERQLDALLRRGPQVTWGSRLKYIGLGVLIGFGIGVGTATWVTRPRDHQSPIVDGGVEDAAGASIPANGELMATTPKSSWPPTSAASPAPSDR